MSPSPIKTATMNIVVWSAMSAGASICTPSTTMTPKTTIAVPPTTAAGIALMNRTIGANRPTRMRMIPAANGDVAARDPGHPHDADVLAAGDHERHAEEAADERDQRVPADRARRVLLDDRGAADRLGVITD